MTRAWRHSVQISACIHRAVANGFQRTSDLKHTKDFHLKHFIKIRNTAVKIAKNVWPNFRQRYLLELMTLIENIQSFFNLNFTGIVSTHCRYYSYLLKLRCLKIEFCNVIVSIRETKHINWIVKMLSARVTYLCNIRGRYCIFHTQTHSEWLVFISIPVRFEKIVRFYYSIIKHNCLFSLRHLLKVNKNSFCVHSAICRKSTNRNCWRWTAVTV